MNRIFCLETEWDQTLHDLKKKSTVLPLLDFLENIQGHTKKDALLLAKDNGIRKAETIINEVAEAISHFRQYAEECEVSQQWIGAAETPLKSHLADWALSEQRKDISFSIDNTLFENVRVERTYKGNYHLLCDVNGKERKFVITNKKDEYALIDKVGVDNLTKEQLILLTKKFLVG